jgi:hypothetical protein
MAIDKVVSASITDSAVTDAKLSFNSNQFRNIIINGDMSVAQRGSSTSSITSSAYHTVDRFKTNISSLGTWTQSQDTTVPTGQGFATSLKMDCTTADGSPGSGDYLNIGTRFEGQMLQYLKKGTSSAESLTLSFWVRSNKTGTYTVELYDSDNTRYVGKTYSISSADTWEKKTITYDGDTTGAFGNDANVSLSVFFWLGAGSDYTGGTFNNGTWGAGGTNTRVSSSQVNLADSTSNEWYITGVQLEAGTAASDFEFLPTDVNLMRCYRYCYVEKLFSGSSGYGSSFAGYNDANYVAFRVNPPQPMRIPPSSVTEVGDVNVWRGNTAYTGWTWGFILGSHGISTFYVSGNKASHGMGTNADYLIQYPSASDALIFSAEL